MNRTDRMLPSCFKSPFYLAVEPVQQMRLIRSSLESEKVTMTKKNILKTFAFGAVVGLSATLTSCDTYYDDRVVASSYKVGDTVTVLPKRYRTVDIDGTAYYYAKGTYYRPRGSSYVVVDRPVTPTTRAYTYGDYFDTLPDRYRTIRYGNRTYYYGNGRYYRLRGNRYMTVRDPFVKGSIWF